MIRKLLSAVICGLGFVAAIPSHAIDVTPNVNALEMATAFTTGGGTGLTVVSATLSGHNVEGVGVSSGTYSNASGTYGIGAGVILSTGNVNDYADGPNNDVDHTAFFGVEATPEQQALLFPISGIDYHYDVTELTVEFTTSTGEVFFNVVFGSEEFDEFYGTPFIDAFGLYVDGANIAYYNGDYININHPSMRFRAGTELDGVLPGTGGPMRFEATGLDTSQTHILKFIIADSGDDILDSTVYLSALGGTKPPEPSLKPGLLPISDVNSDGVADIAVFREAPIRAEVRSGQNGALLRTIEFLSPSMWALAAEPLPDCDGNGVAEIAVLGERKTDGRAVVEIRNVTGVEAPRHVWFAAGHTPLGLAVIGSDADNNGVAELAVLSIRNSDARAMVEVKNAFGPTSPNSIWMGSGLTPSKIEIVEDADGNGIPEVAVLSTRNSDGRIVVEIKNAVGATNPNSVWFMAGNTAIDLTVVGDKDANSVPEVAVLSSRNSDGRNVVEIKNAAGATMPTTVWFMAGHTASAVEGVADADGNSVPEVAVLSERNSDGRIVVEVKNAAGATNPNPLWYSAGYSAGGLAILPDTDNNGIGESAVLLIRDGDGRILVESRNASGPMATNYYWFSP